MHSSTSKISPSSSFSSSSCSIRLSRFTNPNPRWIQLKRRNENQRKIFFKSLKCIRGSDSNIFSFSSSYPLKSNTRNPKSCSAVTETPVGTSNVADKLQSLVTEFRHLSEPIDRVKRLLHYAALLPPFDESARVQANRVMGCTTQVWLEERMDANGLMRFRADSDSEITKGFCSCLIWMLDRAAPEEVLEVKMEDLADMNVGLSGRAHSRVNTWHNVLISMQNRTKALVAEREGKPPLEHFPSLVFSDDDITAKRSYAEAQIWQSKWLKVDANLSLSYVWISCQKMCMQPLIRLALARLVYPRCQMNALVALWQMLQPILYIRAFFRQLQLHFLARYLHKHFIRDKIPSS